MEYKEQCKNENEYKEWCKDNVKLKISVRIRMEFMELCKDED